MGFNDNSKYVNIVVNNATVKLELVNFSSKEHKQLVNELHDKLDVYDSNRYHDSRYTRFHTWDGKTSFFTGDTLECPIGLLDDVYNYVQHRYKFKAVNNRSDKILPKLPPKIVFKGDSDHHTIDMRDYQLEALNRSIKAQNGILNMATNAGKSSLMYAIARYTQPLLKKNEKILVIPPNVQVAHQLKNNFEFYLEQEIGFLGDNICNLEPQIIVATKQSLGSYLTEPEVKLKNAKQKELQRMVEYYRQVKDRPNFRDSFKLFIKNFSPKYKYQIKDMEKLTDILNKYHTERVLRIYFEKLENEYEDLVYSKNKKKFDKFNLAKDTLKDTRVVLVDEIQRAANETFDKIFKYLPNARIRLGFTGTIPKEAEKALKIKAYFGKVIYSVSNQDMIEKGYSTPIYIKFLNFNYPSNLDQQIELKIKGSKVKTSVSLQRYQLAQQYGIIENGKRNTLIAKLAKKLALTEKNKGTNFATIIMINSIEHGNNIINELDKINLTNEIGYEFIQGKDSQQERQKAFDRLSRGETQILIGTKIIDEGVDLPFIKNLIYASGGKSYIQTLQRLGRALRTMGGKDHCVVYDIVDRESSKLYEHAKQRAKYYRKEKFPIIK